MKNYCCQPKKNSRKCIVLCIALLVLSAVAFFLSSYMASFRALGQALSVICLLFFIQLTAKFLLTDYFYTLEEDTLCFSTRQGKRTKSLGSVSLADGLRLYTQKEWDEKKKNFSVGRRFSYCQNLFSEKIRYLLLQDGESVVLLAFEPDDTLLSLLKEKIKEGE